VPTKVSTENGPIHKGDLTVTASLKGYALNGRSCRPDAECTNWRGDWTLASGTRTIEVPVALQ